MENKEVRVRFAPSPTGEPHIGNIRTVVFNWLFARQNNGKFILRIEDTDRTRYQPETINVIMEGLRWLNLDWNEGPDVGGPCGPYTQSERLHLYKKAAEDLVASGRAYRCNCSAERLENLRKENVAGYDRHCRDLPPGTVSADEPHVIRLKVPFEGQAVVKDVIKGDIVFENKDQQDYILLKSDGFPTYHLAVVVDDNLMAITHIIRGDDWISTAPIHVLLYEAFGYEKPVFCHVPLVIAEDGKKLSKRHGATSISEFKEQGYLPEALFNFLTFLGWAPSGGDNQEIFTRDELVKRFELHRVNRAKACFSYTKLNWMNGVYIRNLSSEELAKRLIPFWQKAGLLSEPVPQEIYPKLIRVAELVQEKLKVLPDAIPMTEFLFKDLEIEDPKVLIGKKMTKEESLDALKRVKTVLSEMQEFTSPEIDKHMASLLTELNLNAGQLYSIVRWAVTGQKVSPHLAGSLEVAGKEKSLERLDKAIELLLK